MAKAQARSAVSEQLLMTAIQRTAFVLKPFPEGVDPNEGDAAIVELRAKGWAHGENRHPNLTLAGIEAAQALVSA